MFKILLSGHKGFIGRHIYDHFKSDYHIDTLGRGDKLPKKNYDLVIHFHSVICQVFGVFLILYL